PPAPDANGDPGGCTFCDGLWGGTRDRSQIVEVTSVSETTIGISPPLYTAYTLPAPATPYTAVRTSGVENLQIFGNNPHAGGNGMITMISCAYCWVKGVEFNYPDGDYVKLSWSFRSEILNNYFSNGFNHGPG